MAKLLRKPVAGELASHCLIFNDTALEQRCPFYFAERFASPVIVLMPSFRGQNKICKCSILDTYMTYSITFITSSLNGETAGSKYFSNFPFSSIRYFEKFQLGACSFHPFLFLSVSQLKLHSADHFLSPQIFLPTESSLRNSTCKTGQFPHQFPSPVDQNHWPESR